MKLTVCLSSQRRPVCSKCPQVVYSARTTGSTYISLLQSPFTLCRGRLATHEGRNINCWASFEASERAWEVNSRILIDTIRDRRSGAQPALGANTKMAFSVKITSLPFQPQKVVVGVAKWVHGSSCTEQVGLASQNQRGSSVCCRAIQTFGCLTTMYNSVNVDRRQ